MRGTSSETCSGLCCRGCCSPDFLSVSIFYLCQFFFFLEEQRQKIPKLKVVQRKGSPLPSPFLRLSVFFNAATSFWSLTCGMWNLDLLLCATLLGPHQSSLRAPSLRGPLAAFRSARFASSSFLLSSRFFLDSSALLRPK